MLPYEIIGLILSYTENIYDIIIENEEYRSIINKYSLLFHIDLSNKLITDNDLILFKRVYAIDLSSRIEITDKGLEYLKGVHTINLSNCIYITDKGLEYLKGVHTIDLSNCNQITNKGCEYLKGSHIA